MDKKTHFDNINLVYNSGRRSSYRNGWFEIENQFMIISFNDNNIINCEIFNLDNISRFTYKQKNDETSIDD